MCNLSYTGVLGVFQIKRHTFCREFAGKQNFKFLCFAICSIVPLSIFNAEFLKDEGGIFMSISINGCYDHTLFRDESSGFTLFSLMKANSQHVTVSGIIPKYCSWTPLQIECTESENEHGTVYEIDRITEHELSRDLLLKYLNSCGLTQDTARILACVPGNREFFDYIRSDDYLDGMAGCLSRVQALATRNQILMPVYEREFMEYIHRFLPEQRIRYLKVKAFVSQYGRNSICQLNSDPVNVCMKYLSIPFETADSLAQALGNLDPESRVTAIASACVSSAENSGSTCVSHSDVVRRITEVLTRCSTVVPSSFSIAHTLSNTPGIVCSRCESGQFLYNTATYKSETSIVSHVARLLSAQRDLFSNEEISLATKKVERELGIEYAPAQKDSFYLLSRSGIGIITGGPGTGKTTVVKGLINAYTGKYPEHEIVLTAPTGRAAQRMSEASGLPATTVHRLVGAGQGGRRHSDVQLSADLIIVDESSMLDSEMTSWLFGSVKSGALILLIGDVNQLPSVGAGDILNNLIDSRLIPVCKLETVYRQSGQSSIVSNANLINSGSALLKTDEQFLVHECSEEQMMQKIRDAVCLLYDRKQPFDTQLLCPAHKGACGISAINRELQQLLNSKAPGDREIVFGGTHFRAGDKVILTSNNYDLGYFNGDLGIITRVSGEELAVDVLGRDIRIDRNHFCDVALAYCVSIHKSQGSEFKQVIIVLPGDPASMLRRNLLYTAVTRAKKSCFIISAKGAIETCCKTVETGRRQTRLVPLLKSQIG